MPKAPRPVYPRDADHGQIATSHPLMAEFRRVPRPWWVSNAPLLAALPPFVGWLLLVQAGVGSYLHEDQIFLHILPVVAALFIAWNVAVAGTYVCGVLLGIQDRRRLGKPNDDEMYVGVAYADGFWTFRNDVAWDRGYLRATPDGLVFRGHATEFALPAHAIRSVRLAGSCSTANVDMPRVFVEWAAPDGAISTLSLDGRGILAYGVARRGNIALAEYLLAVLRLSAHDPLRPLWPPAKTPERFVGLTAHRVHRSDRLVATVLSLLAGMGALWISIQYLLPLREAGAPIAAGLFLIAFLFVFGITLNRRINRRLDRLAQIPVDVLPARDVNPAIETDEQHLRA